MELFTLKKKWFVGVDSDGTAFDTMTIKHKSAFIPNIIEIWGLDPIHVAVEKTAGWINLTSVHRGINRFPGLVMTFDLLRQQDEVIKSGVQIPEVSDLNAFVRSGQPMSNDGLRAYLSVHPSLFLEEVLRWSRQSDRDFAKAVKGLSPFPYVRETLKRMSEKANLMIVSAAAGAGLKEDWQQAGILGYMDAVAGQEVGSKSQQLSAAVKAGALSSQSLMIGDGLGDLEAAKENSMLFYPILPGQEEESWHRLYTTVWDSFLSGEYGKSEETYIRQFQAVLGVPDATNPT